MDNLFIKEYADIKRQELYSSPYSCLDSDKIDINPHQIEAFVFAIESIKFGGAILADEVGLGKTIEAGLVIKYLLKNQYHKILLIMPSNLRKQLQIELEEKFNIETLIVDRNNLDDYYDFVHKETSVVITSYNFAAKQNAIFSKVSWDFIVFDEAHRLRNIHKSGSRIAEKVYELTLGIPKILLTATPMQNTLWDMYGLVQFIDDKVFLDKRIFSKKYIKNQEYAELKYQLEPIIQRTLRSEVADYLKFRSRIGITVDFKLSPMEAVLYVAVNEYLKKEIVYAIPVSNRNLVTVVIRKLLASSSLAVASTFEVLKSRLFTLKESSMVESVDKSLDYFFDFLDDEVEEEETEIFPELYDRARVNEFIQSEIDQVENIISLANSIKTNAKLEALKTALNIAFKKLEEMNIEKKVVIFTESVRTQLYLFGELSDCGYENQILVFNGSVNDGRTREIFNAWKARNYGRQVGSRSVEIKNAIVEAFRDEYQILIVTDSGSEGLNLQFCNTIINYDLPWNPQRIEQRIGRCHRYGQKHDVVVINLLNAENIADKRVYEILSQKFELFEGVFGASDKAIGLLENGENFEKRILQIYQQCSSTAEFNREFKGLEKELDRKRNVKFQQLKYLMSRMDEDNHKEELKHRLEEIQQYLYNLRFWNGIEKGCINRYPAAFRLLSTPEKLARKHGYIIIGGFYDNQRLICPVLCVYDDKKCEICILEQEILDIMRSIEDNEVSKLKIDNMQIDSYILKLQDKMEKIYTKNTESIIARNNMKIDNWLALRREEYNLRIKEVETEIEKLNYAYTEEKNFRAKIDIKKKIEKQEQTRTDMMQGYHEYTTTVEREATKLREEFKERFLINPILFVKVIIAF